MTISGIYKIQSKKKPERIYIGSAVNIHKRWNKHLYRLKRSWHTNPKLQHHYNKYGKTDLVFSIIVGCEKDDLIVTEQFYIDAYNPWFNIAPRAGSQLGFKFSPESILKMRESAKKRAPISQETRAKMAANKNSKGKKWNEEQRAKMIGNKNGLGNRGRKGRPFTDEEKKKYSEALKRSWERRRQETILSN